MAPSTFALTAYQSGYKHGLTDGKNSCIRTGWQIRINVMVTTTMYHSQVRALSIRRSLSMDISPHGAQLTHLVQEWTRMVKQVLIYYSLSEITDFFYDDPKYVILASIG